MEEELQNMRDLVAQLRAENERLQQDQVPVGVPGPGAAAANVVPSVTPQSASVSAGAAERFVFIPRERRCPKFNGRSGVSISEWVEEAEACMRLRQMSRLDQAFFLFDHLEGEAREEIKYRPDSEKCDPDKIIFALRDLYGCSESYVALQEVFFSRRQQEGETLLEFSLALLSLLEKVKSRAPHVIPNADTVLRDQFVECVLDSALRRELKQFVRRQPTATLLEVRGEAIRWEREGTLGGVRGRSHSVPLVSGIQYGVHGESGAGIGSSQGTQTSELDELRKLLRQQQQQIDNLTRAIAQNQNSYTRGRSPRMDRIVCRRCQQSGHFARECDGERQPPHPQQRPFAASSSELGQPHRSQPSGN
ncbi:uncharacterized protein [Misgurnus anguillicaudatus]|uniref:uncharacterized protein n=1 Tax=Misgurnus anguillicaudatus TaxID=75329 RepID=UPI003CCF5CF0